jgi:hypothetical protein
MEPEQKELKFLDLILNHTKSGYLQWEHESNGVEDAYTTQLERPHGFESCPLRVFAQDDGVITFQMRWACNPQSSLPHCEWRSGDGDSPLLGQRVNEIYFEARRQRKDRETAEVKNRKEQALRIIDLILQEQEAVK